MKQATQVDMSKATLYTLEPTRLLERMAGKILEVVSDCLFWQSDDSLNIYPSISRRGRGSFSHGA